MKFGIGSYAYAWSIGVPGKMPENPMTVYEFIDRAKALNVSCVEIDDNIPLDQFDIDELKEIKHYAREMGIDTYVGMRKMTPENLMTYLTIAEIMESPFLRVVFDGGDFEPTPDECIGIIKDFLGEFEKRNLDLAIENHDRFSANTFRDIILKSGSDHVKICLDSVNSYGAGESVEKVTNTLGPYTVNLHLKEFSIQRIWHNMGFTIEGVPLGKGQLPVKWILEQIGGHCKSAILELWPPPEKSLEQTIKKEDKWVKESVAYFRKKYFIGDYWI